MIIIENKYDIGTEIYLKGDPEREMFFVVGFQISGPNRNLLYQISTGASTFYCYEFELCTKDEIVC